MMRLTSIVSLGVSLGLAGCVTQAPDRQGSVASATGNCLYGGESYSVGSMKRAMSVVNDAQGVRLVDNPDGPLMRCISRDGSVRWTVIESGARHRRLAPETVARRGDHPRSGIVRR